MTEPTTADSNLHNTLVVIVDKEDVSYGEIGYTTVCCSEDKYAVQFPTHKEIINKSSMEVYSCVLDRLETTEQRLREVGALPEKWRMRGDREWVGASHRHCADELDAKLK